MADKDYKKQYEALAKKVKEMRRHQKAYFRSKMSFELEKAKAAEKEVDQFLKQDETENTQSQLF